MSLVVSFRVDGVPVAKGRPKFRSLGKFVSTYTPKKTKEYEEIVAFKARQAMGETEPLETPIRAFLHFYLPVPASYSKKRTQACLDGSEKHIKKPDLDNMAKSVLDAMNGICYLDDGQIVDLHIHKKYGAEPCVQIVLIEEVD